MPLPLSVNVPVPAFIGPFSVLFGVPVGLSVMLPLLEVIPSDDVMSAPGSAMVIDFPAVVVVAVKSPSSNTFIFPPDWKNKLPVSIPVPDEFVMSLPALAYTLLAWAVTPLPIESTPVPVVVADTPSHPAANKRSPPPLTSTPALRVRLPLAYSLT